MNKLIYSLINYIVILIVKCFFQTQSIFFIGIYIDSLCSAIQFIKSYFVDSYINDSLSISHIVTATDNVYKIGSLERYIYYFVLQMFYCVLTFSFWIPENPFLIDIFLVFLIPEIINYLSKTILSNFFGIIKNEKKNITRLIICKYSNILIKKISSIYIQNPIDLKDEELMNIFNDYDLSIHYFYEFIKNGLVLCIISYLYKKTNYGKIINYISSYKIGIRLKLTPIDITNSEKYMIELINNKQWEKIIEPITFQHLMIIYQSKEGPNQIEYLIKIIKFNILGIFSLWTLASTLNVPIIIPILAFFMKLFSKNINIEYGIYTLIMMPISVLISNNPITSMLCMFGYELLFSKLSKFLMNIFFVKIKNTIVKYHDPFCNNKYVRVIGYFSIMYLLYIIYFYCNPNIFIIANTLITIFLNKHNRYIYGFLICTSLLSNFNLFHSLFNSYIVFLITTAYIKHTSQQNIEILKESQIIIKNHDDNGFYVIDDYVPTEIIKSRLVISDTGLLHNKLIKQEPT